MSLNYRTHHIHRLTQTGRENSPADVDAHLKLVIIMQSHIKTEALNEKPNKPTETTQQTLNKLMNIHHFSVCLFSVSFHSTGQIFVALVCRCVGVDCVCFSRSVRELQSTDGPNVPIVLYICFAFAMVCAFYFSLCPFLCVLACALCVWASCYGKSNFLCISRSHFHCQNLQYNCVLLLRLLLPLLLRLPFEFTVFLFLSCSSYLPSSFAHHERPSHLRICEFFFFLSSLCSVLPSSCFALLIRWENGV